MVETERQLNLTPPNYSLSSNTFFDHIKAFLTGGIAGAVVLYVFYKIIPLAAAGGVIVGIINIIVSKGGTIEKRRCALRAQFYDMLEALAVSMRAGNPFYKALQSARNDLRMTYGDNADIIVELNIILVKFNNAIPLSQAFEDFAKRSGLEDIASFASVYSTIEGKSSRADEIVRDTQQIISDKMEIEMEIETLMTAAKSEVNIMLFLPLLVLLVIGYMGAGFMDSIYTTDTGRLIATGGLVMFVISYILAKKFSNIEL